MEFRIKPNTLGTRVTLVRHAALVTELCEALITKLTIGSSKLGFSLNSRNQLLITKRKENHYNWQLAIVLLKSLVWVMGN